MGTLNSLIVAYGDRIGASAYEVIIVELSTLIRFSSLLLESSENLKWMIALLSVSNLSSLDLSVYQ